MKKTIILLLLALMSPVSAFSDGGPPQTLPFSFSDGRGYFAEAVAVTLSQILGYWMRVGAAKRSDYDAHLTEGYDPNGLKNTDGSLDSELFFSQFTAPFDGSVRDQVQVLQLGNKDTSQGPYEVVITSGVSGANFAEWGYDADGGFSSTHYDYDCRLMPQDSSKMICAITVRGAVYWPWTTWNGAVVFYAAYARQ